VEEAAVYLRHAIRRKRGKTHTYWRLVRSVRRGGTVVQETVAQLGELDVQGRAKARALARHITGRGDQRELFEAASAPAETIAVRLDKIRLERRRVFGSVWLGWTLWRAVGLDGVCAELLPTGRETVPWPLMAVVLVLARLCDPSSELHIAEDWYRSTALEDLLGVPSEQLNDDRLYRALDRLLPHKAAIEAQLKERLGTLFSLDYDLLLYDVTSTYFEGLGGSNPQAQRGYSRDHRPDCKQVNIALVVTRGGIPLGYEVFSGNRTDVTTMQEIVETIESRYGKAERIWVMDRGMTSRKNVAWLQQTGRRYLIGTSRTELRRWEREIASEHDWTTVREGGEVKLCAGRTGQEIFLLCRSAERRAKEQGMHARFAARIEAGLDKLAQRIERSRKALDRSALERQIGRLLGRNRRAAGRYHIQLVGDPALPAKLRLRWGINKPWDERTRQHEGCYILRTNVTNWTPETMWRTYIQLWEVEAAFRIHKTELSIRPIWHQKQDRVQAHILVCFLAYVLWKTLEQWQTRAGLGNSPRTILTELGRIQSTDVVLPLADNPSRHVRLRCVVRPDKDQAVLLDRLGLRLPERLKIPAAMTEM
jgi:transposase